MSRRRRTWRRTPIRAWPPAALLGPAVWFVWGLAGAAVIFQVVRAAAMRWWRLDAPVTGAVLALGVWWWWAARVKARAAAARRRQLNRQLAARQAEVDRREQDRQAGSDRQIATTDALTGRAFEQLVARLLVRDGWTQVEVSGGAGDLGADVVARSPTGGRLVVQCKRYGAAAVSSPDMQRFLGTVYTHHRADLALFVTTSTYTRPAAELAGSHGVTLVDRPVLAAWMAGRPLLLPSEPSVPATVRAARWTPRQPAGLQPLPEPR